MIRIVTLDEAGLVARLDALVALLADSVDSGASVGFMEDMSREEAEDFWRGCGQAISAGERIVLIAEDDDPETGLSLLGTVQVGFSPKANQRHRGDLMKLLVHRKARGRGLARRLMAEAEEASRLAGRWLLVLDTATGSDAEAIYPRLGWIKVGSIPDYAMWPDGRYCATTYFYKTLTG